MVVVLLLAIQTAAHIAMRALGQRYGPAVSGFAAGFVSSTSTFAAMAASSKAEPDLAPKLALACLLSHLASLVQLIGLVSLLAPHLLGSIIASVGVTCAGLIIKGYLSLRNVEPQTLAFRAAVDTKKAMFNPIQTLTFAVLLSALTVAMSLITNHFGEKVAKYAAIIAGMFDMHASSAAILSVVSIQPLSSMAKQNLLITILSIVSLNVLVKLAISTMGDRNFFKEVMPTLVLTTLASWLFVFLL